MKKIIFTLLLMVPMLMQAQDFTNICSAGPAFYQKMNTNAVKAFRYTGYTLPGNTDTIFYTFPTIMDTSATCLDTTKGSIFGKKIYRVGATKVFYFFNKRNDTITINAKALVDMSWKFVTLTSGTYLEAKVVSIGPDTVMGVQDDVMKIQLTAKRMDGTTVANPWNGKYLKLSKHYGLARTFNMTQLPFDTTYYVLQGKFKPITGLQDFGWKEVYSFNVGDIFHYTGYDNGLAPGQTSTWKEIQTVISKTPYGNSDSVLYKFDRCRSTVTNPGGNHVYFRDTIVVMYRFKTALAADSSILRYPDQFKRENIYASQYDRFFKLYNNRQTKKIGQDKYRFLNNCFEIPTGSVLLNKSYSEGLGQSEYFRDDQTVQNYIKLVYFKKGGETWGSPVGTECSPALDVPEQPAVTTQEVRIVPNPMKNQAELLLDGVNFNEGIRFAIYNLVGKEVLSRTVTSGRTTIEKNGLVPGMYIYRLTGKQTIATGKLIIE